MIVTQLRVAREALDRRRRPRGAGDARDTPGGVERDEGRWIDPQQFVVEFENQRPVEPLRRDGTRMRRRDRRLDMVGGYVRAIQRAVEIRESRSEEHTSELQSHSFISYAVFC